MYTEKGWDLHEENIRTPSWDLYGENMIYTLREHKLYVNRAWDVKNESIRQYKICIKRSIWRKHNVLIKRSWDLHEDSMNLQDDSLHKEIIKKS